ncbi:hypothetical protein [Paenibacillus sp. 453mf]|uniref:hypothetical protein n=1 Tax=Paenibacillus sp. 453mf TaxID=1761874 RepID=UPI0008DF0403|nr:hypothetical protein [Paenibacillus sp. 453mf]SFS72046.1 hypothetical protein SAMN04488601_102211 [Paenibacillus sp. 453mf]
MKLKKIIPLIFIAFAVGFTLQIIIQQNETIETKIERKIKIQDNTLQKLIHYEIKNNIIYAFYTNTVYNTSSGLGLSVIENNKGMSTHIIGAIELDSKKGLTYEISESKQLNLNVVYGSINNSEIKTIQINGHDCNIVNATDLTFWYYISENPMQSTLIEAKDQTGKVIINETF